MMIILTLEGKTHYSGNIHPNTDEKTLNMTEEKFYSYMLHMIMTQYGLNTGLIKFK